MSPTPTATIVIPTRNEAANAQELLMRLDAALQDRAVAVIFVDDGDDDLPAIVGRTAPHVSLSVRVIRREHPTGGLGGAVALGMRESQTDLGVVCDGEVGRAACREGMADVGDGGEESKRGWRDAG